MKSVRLGAKNCLFNASDLTATLCRGRQTVLSIIFVVMALLMSSCASTSRMAIPLTNFSSSVADATVATKTALGTMQSVDIEKLAYEASTEKNLSENSFKWFLSSDDVRQRVLVLDALAAYAGKMKELSGLDKSEDIKKNFADLKKNLDSASQTIEKASPGAKKLPEGVAGALTLIGEGLVNIYVAQERDQAISDALEKTNPLIRKICELMSSEYSKEEKGIFYQQLQYSYRKLQEPVSEKFASAKEQEKLSLAKEYGTLIKKKEISLSLFASISDSFTKIADAHNALLLQSKRNINSEDQLNALGAQIESTRYYYSQLVK